MLPYVPLSRFLLAQGLVFGAPRPLKDSYTRTSSINGEASHLGLIVEQLGDRLSILVLVVSSGLRCVCCVRSQAEVSRPLHEDILGRDISSLSEGVSVDSAKDAHR